MKDHEKYPLWCIQRGSAPQDYKVNLKTRLDAMSLRAKRILQYKRCECDVHHLIAQSWKYWIFQATLRGTVPRQPISVEFPPTSLTSWWHKRCRNLSNGHWIRHSGQNNCCCVWIAQSSYNTTLCTTGLSCKHRHGVVKFSNVSGNSTTDTVQKWWLYHP